MDLVPPAAGQRNGNCIVSGEVAEPGPDPFDNPTHHSLGAAVQFNIISGP